MAEKAPDRKLVGAVAESVVRHLLPITLVLAFSFSMKIWQLDGNPAGFFADEAGIGCTAGRIAKTGADRYQERFPLFFRGYACDATPC